MNSVVRTDLFANPANRAGVFVNNNDFIALFFKNTSWTVVHAFSYCVAFVIINYYFWH